ncbi:hypothetical protein BH11MYX1_BH11MYX1_46310 [soil metagenome]
MLETGFLVAGKLRIERLLGQGGMGTVYVATHLGLDQQVAIKVLDPALAQNAEVVQRFVREARASAKLKSDHVCRVMDVGALADGVPYIEMEMLIGEDLGQLIERSPLPTETAAEYVLQACIAIAEAHTLGIVHRDLKPANLFVTRRLDGSALVKVLDFGIATAPTEQQELKITKTTAVMGSPGYMSPEQLRSARDVDARSDIWALGVILYEAASGRLPFVAHTITELAVKVVMDPPDALGGVDPQYAAIVARCLAKDPVQRYQNIAELAFDLSPIAGPNAQASQMMVMRLSPGGASASMPVARGPSGPSGPSGAVRSPTAPKGLGFESTAVGTTGAEQPAIPSQVVGTTLGAAAGMSSPMLQEAHKKKRGVAIIAAIVVLGGAAAAVITITQSTGKQTAPAEAHRDAGVTVVIAPADSALVIAPVDAAPAPADEAMLSGLVSLREDKDWDAILTMTGGKATGDPKIDEIVAFAKTNYTGERVAALKGYAARHDCAGARKGLDDSKKTLPEQATTFAAAAKCVAAAPKPQPSADDIANSASEALEKNDYGSALALADQALKKDPKNLTALDTAARAARSTGDRAMADRAKGYLGKLSPADRVVATKVCRDKGITFARPAAPPRPPTSPEPPIARAQIGLELANANRLLLDANYGDAQKLAKRILAADAGNSGALRVYGLASCHLNQTTNAQDAISSLGRPGTGLGVLRRQKFIEEINAACDHN